MGSHSKERGDDTFHGVIFYGHGARRRVVKGESEPRMLTHGRAKSWTPEVTRSCAAALGASSPATNVDANTKKFTEKTGVEVRVDNEGWEDVRPKAAVAANIGSGPDLILGWFDDPHQYPDKLVDMSDVANYLGGKYGGWYDVCRRYGTRGGKWIAVPFGVIGNAIVIAQSRESGRSTASRRTPGFPSSARR
jgi:hypothetical protein